MDLRGVGRLLISVSALVLGCYSPNIQQGGFACGDGGACPDNFKCNLVDHRCYQGPHDAAVEKLVCKSDATTPEVCSAEHVSGQTCNPGCQTGCGDCGWCAIVGGATTCLTGPGGKKVVGDVCNPLVQADCLPGLYCQPEAACGSARCYRLCDISDAAACGQGLDCKVVPRNNGGEALSSFATLCTLAESCDPVLNQGCQAPFACHLTGATTTECDCPGATATGQSCKFVVQCIGGDSCVGLDNSSAFCRQTCKVTTDCASGTCNTQPDLTYGYCL
jgi:hypothetical protein